MKKENNSVLDLRDIFYIIRKRKWLLVIPVFLVTVLAFGGTFFLEPKYQSSTIIWIDKPDNFSTELGRLLGSSNNRRMTRDEQAGRRLALQTEITSRNYLLQLVRTLGLDDDPEIAREAAKTREKFPDQSLEVIKENLLIDKLTSQITVEFHGSDQVRITCESTNPAQAKDMAKELARIMEREKAQDEMDRILDNQDFTDQQLQKMERHYKEAIDSLNAARSRLSQLQLPENITSEQNRLEIISTIDKTELEQNDYLREMNSLKNQLEANDLENQRLKYIDTIIELRTNIDGLVSDYANMMERYAWNDQNVININIRLNDYIKLLEASLSSSVQSQFESFPENHRDLIERKVIAQENYDILNSKKKKLSQTLSKIDERINKIPELESEILELQNRVQNYGTYRDAFRTEEATVDILSEQMKDRTKYKIIEQAKFPLAPFWPNKVKIILVGFALGLMIGAGFVFFAEVLDKSFKKVEDVEDELELEVLASVPKIEKYNLIR